jgi:hypothetical protein
MMEPWEDKELQELYDMWQRRGSSIRFQIGDSSIGIKFPFELIRDARRPSDTGSTALRRQGIGERF